MLGFSTTLFSAAVIILVFLGIYGLSFILLALKLTRTPAPPPPHSGNVNSDHGSVTVLIPAHHEGSSVVDTVETLLKQDYKGEILIRVLLEGNSDPTYQALRARFAKNDRVEVVLCGVAPKRLKINLALKTITSKYLAILDADHLSALDWISTSVAQLEANPSFAATQSRRSPLSIAKLCQLWDSTQNHLGNEAVNVVFSSLKKGVFFTGTTCVFRTLALKGKELADCITEDTYLSYDLLKEKLLILYNELSGSHEQLAPDYKSYLSRRRRWSCGHTHSFFKHLFVARSPRLVLHGLFFLTGPVVTVLLNIFSLHVYVQLTWRIQCLAIALAAAIAFGLASLLGKRYAKLPLDTLVSFACVFPIITMVMPLIYLVRDDELGYYILTFPYSSTLVPIEIFLAFCPFLVTLAANRRFKSLKWTEIITLIPTYPVFLFLDILAGTLGFVDFILKRNIWASTTRDSTMQVGLVPKAMTPKSSRSKRVGRNSLKYLLAPIFGLLFIVVNDLTYDDNCDDPRPLIFKPFVFNSKTGLTMNTQVVQKKIDGDTFDSLVETHVTNPTHKSIRVEYRLDGTKIHSEEFSDDLHVVSFPIRQKFGWEKKPFIALLHATGASCNRSRWISSAMREIKGRGLYMNGEPFLIKGIIPSFSAKRVNLEMEAGLAQIKKTGANTVRFYHYPSTEIHRLTEAEHLLVIDQPDKSTWKNENIDWEFRAATLLQRYADLDRKTAGLPFSLFHNLGNELELGLSPSRGGFLISSLLDRISASTQHEPIFGYATYLTYRNYPAPILGVNMLDTGSTYWNDALDILSGFNKPFYASELGGFVAYFERPPSTVRALRLKAQWAKLLQAGALGGIVFQSHDNWAQPVAEGFNDPTQPDLPDDERGLWTESNAPKFELSAVEDMFSDVELTVLDQTLSPAAKTFKARLTNKRPYEIKDLRLNMPDGSSILVGTLAPKASTTVDSLPTKGVTANASRIEATFTSHHGLKSYASIRTFLPQPAELPFSLAADFVTRNTSNTLLEGQFFGGGDLHVMIPESWKNFEFNGQTLVRPSNGMLAIKLSPTSFEPANLEVSIDGISWSHFPAYDPGLGPYQIRFTMPNSALREPFLIIDGLGNDSFQLAQGVGSANVECQPYRECVVPLTGSQFNNQDKVTLRINRESVTYLDSRIDSMVPHDVAIKLGKPSIFSPFQITLRKL